MPPSARDILESRLASEAQRQGLDVEVLRHRLLEIGLDGLKAEREQQRAMEAAQAMEATLKADIVVVTATQTERDQLRSEVEERGLALEDVRGRLPYMRISGMDPWRVLWLQVEIGPFGARGSAAQCLTARMETRATTFMLVGTAFGTAGSTYGDVLVSDGVCLYDNRRVKQDHGNVIATCRNDVHLASAFWVQRFRAFADGQRRLSGPYRMQIGTLLSGGAVVESALYRDSLADRVPKLLDSSVIGGEMEAAGMIAAAEDLDWVVVKGVCDFADGTSRNDKADLRKRQIQAARNAGNAMIGTVLMTPKNPEKQC